MRSRMKKDLIDGRKGLRVVLQERGLWAEFEALHKSAGYKRRLLSRYGVFTQRGTL
jgi:hypothetical protein